MRDDPKHTPIVTDPPMTSAPALPLAGPAPPPAPVAPTFAPIQAGKPDPIAVRVMASPPFVPVIDNPSPVVPGAPAIDPLTGLAVVTAKGDDPLAANRSPKDATRIIPKPMGGGHKAKKSAEHAERRH